jgi:uncharacterized protein
MDSTGAPPFPCFACGECCTRYQALLGVADVKRLAQNLGLSPEEFAGRYADPRWPGTEQCLLRHDREGCVFLYRRGRAALCRVHELKPQPCRDWEAGADKPECREGLAKVWNLTVGADSRIEGEASRVAEFQEFLRRLGAE